MLPEGSESVHPGQGKDVDALFERLGISPSSYRHFQRTSSFQRPREQEFPESGSSAGASTTPISTPARSAPSKRTLPVASGKRVAHATYAQFLVPPRRESSEAFKIALFALPGGTGKTTLAAAMARVFAERSTACTLVNCADAYTVPSLLRNPSPLFGVLSFLHAPAGREGYPVTVIEAKPGDLGAQTHAGSLLDHATRDSAVMFFDLPSGTGQDQRDLLVQMDRILVPLVPDRRCLASVAALEKLVPSGPGAPGVSYVLNRFDPQNELHHDLYGRLEAMVGSGLLKTTIPDESAVEEAAHAGMALCDYAPETRASLAIHALCNSFHAEFLSAAVPFLSSTEASA